jgi:Fe-S cluster assembly ATPase SufC
MRDGTPHEPPEPHDCNHGIFNFHAGILKHVMIKGAIVESGGPALAHRLEKEGYAKYGVGEKISLE